MSKDKKPPFYTPDLRKLKGDPLMDAVLQLLLGAAALAAFTLIAVAAIGLANLLT